MQRFKQWLCQVFGHSFSMIDAVIFTIKTDPLNNKMDARITCRRCGIDFCHVDSPLAIKGNNE